jgi:sugar phosphate isomerase/epimerase
VSTGELAISTSWNSQRHQDGYAMLAELADMGYESVELGHGVPFTLWPGIRKALAEKMVRVVSLHNFCPLPMGITKPAPDCFEFTDPEPRRRRRAIKQTIETLEHAAEAGARAVVLHLGSGRSGETTHRLQEWWAQGKFGSRRYVKTKLGEVVRREKEEAHLMPLVQEALAELRGEAHKRGILLGCECREASEKFPFDPFWDQVLEPWQDTIGYWHDFGHAARKEALGFFDHAAFFEKRSARLIGCHVQDFLPPRYDHRALGDGVIDWPVFWKSLTCPMKQEDATGRKSAGLAPLVGDPKKLPLFVLELSPRVEADKVRACLKWWKEKGPAAGSLAR